jgi:hypothetical protein
MASPYEDLVTGGKAHHAEKRQRLTVFTEADCALIVKALGHYAGEYATVDEAARLNHLVERLS